MQSNNIRDYLSLLFDMSFSNVIRARKVFDDCPCPDNALLLYDVSQKYEVIVKIKGDIENILSSESIKPSL